MKKRTSIITTIVFRTLVVLTLYLSSHVTTYAQQVRTARDFILALKSNANITMTTGNDAVNLTDALNELIAEGRIKPYNLDPDWIRVQTKPGIYYSSEYDGNQLIIVGMSNINIEGKGNYGAYLQVDPRYATVMMFINCQNIGISNFTMGHTDTGNCVGDVLEFHDCEDIAVNNCRLFGCGVNGLTLKSCKGISANDTHFYGCSNWGIRLFDTQWALFIGCQIYSNTMGIYMDETCSDVTMDKCMFLNNKREVFSCQSPLTVRNSSIESHGGTNVFNVNLEACDINMDCNDCEDY